MSQFQKDHLSLLGSPHKSFCSSYFLLPSLFQCPIAQLIEFYPNWASPSLARRNRGSEPSASPYPAFLLPVPLSPDPCPLLSCSCPLRRLKTHPCHLATQSFGFSFPFLLVFNLAFLTHVC